MDGDKSGTMRRFLFLFYDANELKAVSLHKRRKGSEDVWKGPLTYMFNQRETTKNV